MTSFLNACWSLAAIGLFLSFDAAAADVKSARYNAEDDTVSVNVVHGGGCGTHRYSLTFDDHCLETLPAQTGAELVHRSNDPCEALISREARVSVKRLLCRPAYLTIRGDRGTSARVLVPAAVRD